MTDLSTTGARWQLANKYAAKYSLDAALVCAVIEQESGWLPWSIRYEPAFYERYIVKLHLPNATEAQARAFSWGLMQIMGQVAREFGYTGPLAALCDPEVGLDWGCKKLAKCIQDNGGDVPKGLLRWNGGGNALYAGQVTARIPKYQEETA